MLGEVPSEGCLVWVCLSKGVIIQVAANPAALQYVIYSRQYKVQAVSGYSSQRVAYCMSLRIALLPGLYGVHVSGWLGCG
jgi:hypothetical protein